MIVVRGNTLPDYHTLSVHAGGAGLDGYQHREKWQHMPIMGVNINEMGAATEDADLSEIKSAMELLERVDFVLSKYNVHRAFEDGQTVYMNLLSEAVLMLTQEEMGELSQRQGKTFRLDGSVLLYRLFQLGVIVRADEDEKFKIRVIRERSAFASDDAINITIYPTQECNARCAYCFEYGEKRTPMSQETLKQVIEYIEKNVTEQDEVVFRWFGGEPLLGADKMDAIVEHVDRHFGGKLKYSSIITTNGFLIDDDLIVKARDKWHAKKFHLTIDGYGEEHNRRKNYYDQSVDAYQKTLSDIRKLTDAGIFVVCRLNLDQKNFDQVDAILKDLIPFRDSPNFYIHATTLRRPPDAPLEDYILPQDFAGVYETLYRKMYQYGFYKEINNILPLRARGNCLACVMNGVIINADGNLFKCLQHTTDPSQRIGTCASGIQFNPVFLGWMDLSMDRPECQTCPFLPCCTGGCKHYRSVNRPEITPCAREKFYLPAVFQLIHEWIVNGGKLAGDCHAV